MKYPIHLSEARAWSCEGTEPYISTCYYKRHPVLNRLRLNSLHHRFATFSEAEAHCLRRGKLAPRVLPRVNYGIRAHCTGVCNLLRGRGPFPPEADQPSAEPQIAAEGSRLAFYFASTAESGFDRGPESFVCPPIVNAWKI